MRPEQPLTIGTLGGGLPAILHPGSEGAKLGVLIVVGGPQYRVGSHRQFVQLARALACEDIPVLRFDSTGMGDSVNQRTPFDQLDDDIQLVLDRFFIECPALDGVVLWGLCDGASAALLYGAADQRVCGLVLVNPWLENDQAQARVRLYDYYLKRFFSRSFWKKLLSGGIKLSDSVRDVGGSVKGAATISPKSAEAGGYQQRMLDAFDRFDRPVCWILSGNDLTASAFTRQYQSDAGWLRAATGKVIQIERLEDADHTFSNGCWKGWLAAQTLTFVRSLDLSRD